MKLKRVLGAVALSLSLITLTACGGAERSASGDDSKVYELNLNVSAAPTSPFTQQAANPWAEYVEEQTDGKIKVNVFPSAGLGSLSTAWEDISAGLYEGGFAPPGLHVDTELFPMTIADIPFLITSPETAQKVLAKFSDKYMKDVFVDSTLVGVSSTDAYQIYSTSPIKTVKDLKNFKISDTVTARIDLFKELGSVPVSLSNTELYESLERGVVEAVAYTAVGANGYKFDEVAPYMTKIDMAVSTLPIFINTNFLNSLTEDLRKQFMDDLGPKYAELITELYTTQAEEGVNIFEGNVKDQGGSVYVPTEEELAEFKAPVKKQMEAWVKEADKRGYKGQEMMDYFVELLEAEGIEAPK